MSEQYKLEGKVKFIGETQEIGAKGFKKRQIVITTGDKYPQDVSFEFTKETVSKLDRVQVGDDVTVHFNINGKEYNGKYFNALVGWRIESDSQSGSSTQTSRNEATAALSAAGINEADDNSIPF